MGILTLTGLDKLENVISIVRINNKLNNTSVWLLLMILSA